MNSPNEIFYDGKETSEVSSYRDSRRKARGIIVPLGRQGFNIFQNNFSLIAKALSFIHISDFFLLQCVCKTWQGTLNHSNTILNVLTRCSAVRELYLDRVLLNQAVLKKMSTLQLTTLSLYCIEMSEAQGLRVQHNSQETEKSTAAENIKRLHRPLNADDVRDVLFVCGRLIQHLRLDVSVGAMSQGTFALMPRLTRLEAILPPTSSFVSFHSCQAPPPMTVRLQAGPGAGPSPAVRLALPKTSSLAGPVDAASYRAALCANEDSIQLMHLLLAMRDRGRVRPVVGSKDSSQSVPQPEALLLVGVKGEILAANQAWEKMFGRTSQASAGLHWTSVRCDGTSCDMVLETEECIRNRWRNSGTTEEAKHIEFTTYFSYLGASRHAFLAQCCFFPFISWNRLGTSLTHECLSPDSLQSVFDNLVTKLQPYESGEIERKPYARDKFDDFGVGVSLEDVPSGHECAPATDPTSSSPSSKASPRMGAPPAPAGGLRRSESFRRVTRLSFRGHLAGTTEAVKEQRGTGGTGATTDSPDDSRHKHRPRGDHPVHLIRFGVVSEPIQYCDVASSDEKLR